MTATITRYPTRVEAAEQNAALLDAVFAELAEMDADHRHWNQTGNDRRKGDMSCTGAAHVTTTAIIRPGHTFE